jgi:hypothetical protein
MQPRCGAGNFRPGFGGAAPPAAVFFYAPVSQHPQQHLAGHCGIVQADAYAGFSMLYEPAENRARSRKPAGPLRPRKSTTS